MNWGAALHAEKVNWWIAYVARFPGEVRELKLGSALFMHHLGGSPDWHGERDEWIREQLR